MMVAGIDDVRLLDGGFTAWRAAGYAVETIVRHPDPVYAYLMGWPTIAVYDGGWLEWSQDDANPVAIGVPVTSARSVPLPRHHATAHRSNGLETAPGAFQERRSRPHENRLSDAPAAALAVPPRVAARRCDRHSATSRDG